MKTQELRNELSNNNIVKIILEGEWTMVKNTNSMLGNNIRIDHLWNIDKWEEFETEDEAVKFFMSKVSYFKSLLKRKKITRDVQITIIK